MTDITSSCTIVPSVVGNMKVLAIQTPAAAATGDTIDLASDATDGKGVIMTTIHNTYIEDDAGALKIATFDPATGIITLGTITTGIHNLTVNGI